MSELSLPGCPTTPLGGYLAALGVLRATTRLLDDEATGRWEGQRFVLGSRFGSLEDLVDTLRERFEPEAIVSPWNAGSGFAGNGKNVTAERALHSVRESEDPRLARLKEAVAAGDRVVAQGRARGWGGKDEELWDKNRKRDVLALCRSEFPDHALPWLDAAVALAQDTEVAFSRLLGTGGNFGRQDLSATYLARLSTVLTSRDSRGWLRDALSGEESTPYLRDTLGQFDPGRAGGIQSSTFEKADDSGFVNPWAFLLTLEGALLFATAVVRRHGTAYARAALPFQVHSSAAGFTTQAPGERVLAELWAPEWSTPARLDDVAHLLAEGRADWGNHPATSGLDFARAIATLGVDRGITAFERHLFVDRLGQNPLAVPAGRIEVRRRQGVELLAGVDHWLHRLRGDLPALVETRRRGVEQALFAHAGSGKAQDLVEVIAAVGRCHEAVARSGAVREIVRPLVLPVGPALFDELRAAAAEDPDLRIALALATARDPAKGASSVLPLRTLLSPVTAERYPNWTRRPPLTSLSTGLSAALTEAARRRAFPGAVDDDDSDLEPAVQGVRISYRRGVQISAGTLDAFVTGDVDDERVADLLAGLLTVDWDRTPDALLAGDSHWVDPALSLLLAFTGTSALRLPTEILLRPGQEWPLLLQAGHVAQVLDDAARRLRIAGLPHVISPVTAPPDGARLGAALLVRVPDTERRAALRRVAVLPDSANHQNQEIPA